MPASRIIADIGGTNARFAYSPKPGVITQELTLPTADHPTFESALSTYLDYLPKDCLDVHTLCLAVAGPVKNGRVDMTNLHWTIDRNIILTETINDHQFTQVAVINDFEAIALSLPYLTGEQKIALGPDIPAQHAPLTVLGPGTGLGAALLVPEQNQWQAISTEGGHVSLGPLTDDDFSLFRYWQQKGRDTARENFLCGVGLARIFEAIYYQQHQAEKVIQPAAVTTLANQGDELAIKAVMQFCALLGSAAGDQALATGARGGVFIAGGISLKLKDYLLNSDFRSRFDNKSIMQHYLKQIPTYLITDPNPGLIGASHAPTA